MVVPIGGAKCRGVVVKGSTWGSLFKGKKEQGCKNPGERKCGRKVTVF